jgi:hypothetical protein
VPDVEIVLDGGIAGLEVEGVRAGLRVPSRHPEHAGAADDGHLPDGGEHLVPAHDGDAAPVVRAGLEHEVHGHQQRHRALAGADVGPLRAAEEAGGAQAGALRQRVVDHHHGAEEGLGRVGRRRARHLHRRRVRPAHHVVPVHPDVRLLLLAGSSAVHRRTQSTCSVALIVSKEDGVSNYEEIGSRTGNQSRQQELVLDEDRLRVIIWSSEYLCCNRWVSRTKYIACA